MGDTRKGRLEIEEERGAVGVDRRKERGLPRAGVHSKRGLDGFGDVLDATLNGSFRRVIAERVHHCVRLRKCTRKSNTL